MSEADWLNALRQACSKRSQQSVGNQIGYSVAVVNATLKGKYTGDLQAVEDAIREKLMDAKVNCPVWPDAPIPLEQCKDYQRVKPPFNNPVKRHMYNACNGCPHAKIKRANK